MDWKEFALWLGQMVISFLILINAVLMTHTLSRKWLRTSSALIRGCASLVFFLWGATILFHVLSALTLFHWGPALILLILGNILWVKKADVALFVEEWNRNKRRLFHFHRLLQKSSLRWVYRGLGVGVLFLLIRVAILPPLGWDGQTYHMVKAGMWVQNQGELPLKAPGGWSFHRNRLAGGEVLQAWAMLLLHRDTLSGIFEFWIWISLGISFFALGKEVGLKNHLALLASCYLLSIPIILLAVGSGYIELFLNLSLSLSFLFLVRFLKTKEASFLLLSFMSFGVALGMQLTPWPLFVFFLGFLFVALWHFHSRRLWKTFIGGIVLVFLVVFPWNLKLWMETGYPFGNIEFRLGPLQLGQGTPELHWALSFPGLLAYDIRAELYTALILFQFPYQGNPHSYATLGSFTLLPLFFFSVACLGTLFSKKYMPFFGAIFVLGLLMINPWVVNWLILNYSKQKIPLNSVLLNVIFVFFAGLMIFFIGYLFKKRDFFIRTPISPWVLLFFVGSAFLTLALFYHPQFSSRRLFWSGNCTRFLFPLIGPALLISLSWCSSRLKFASIYVCLLWIGTCVHGIQCLFHGWARFEFFVIPSIALALIGGGYVFIRKCSFSSKHFLRFSLFLWIVVVSVLEGGRSWIRHQAVAQSSIYQFVPTYWTEASQFLDQKAPLQLAVTSNPNKFGDNWFLYFFLGQRLQNQLSYIPISYTGQILNFYEGFERNQSGHFPSWFERLQTQKLDYVVSFGPASIELEWMRTRPEWFEFILGDPLLWGVYRIKKF